MEKIFIINGNYTLLDRNIYENIDLNHYEIYNQLKYIYIEGLYEDYYEKLNIMFFFLTSSIYSITFELNMKYPIFQLQINDYIQCSYFRENFSFIGKYNYSSFNNDIGKNALMLLFYFLMQLN